MIKLKQNEEKCLMSREMNLHSSSVPLSHLEDFQRVYLFHLAFEQQCDIDQTSRKYVSGTKRGTAVVS